MSSGAVYLLVDSDRHVRFIFSQDLDDLYQSEKEMHTRSRLVCLTYEINV